MSKITLPFKKYKKSSIDLVEKRFDPELRGEWTGGLELIHVFMSTYIQEKFKDIFILPFIDFRLIHTSPLQRPEIVLVDYSKLLMRFFSTDSIEDYTTKYMKSPKRFTFFPMSIGERNIKNDDFDYHSVSALHDTKSNKVEIFDSIGSNFAPYTEILDNFFVSIYGAGIKIVYIVDRCAGFGKLAAEKCDKTQYNYNSGGFCAIWSLWFLELRLSNPNIAKEKLVEKALKRLKNGGKVCELLRGYAQFIDGIFSKYYLSRTSSNLIIKPKNTKKSGFTKKDYSYLYIILAAIFGSIVATGIIQKIKN